MELGVTDVANLKNRSTNDTHVYGELFLRNFQREKKIFVLDAGENGSKRYTVPSKIGFNCQASQFKTVQKTNNDKAGLLHGYNIIQTHLNFIRVNST